MAHNFHPDFPDQCPPSEASEIDRDIFRGIPSPPISEDDFISHAELKKRHEEGADADKKRYQKVDETNCEHWGLSVWQTQAEAENARGIHNYMRKWHVAKGRVKPQHGRFLPTPNDNHAEHCTFWKVLGLDLVGSFEIVLLPLRGRS